MTDDLVVYDRTVLHLVFDDPRMGGLEVKVRSLSVGEYTDLGQDGDVINKFVECLVWWNLGKKSAKGKAVKAPLTRESFDGQLEPWQSLKVLTEWRRAVVGLSDPLDRPSSNGDRFLEASMPMDPA